MALLDQFLQKIGVQSFSELNDEEKQTFRQWESALQGRKLTDDEVARFLEREKQEAVEKLTTLKLSERDDTFLKMEVHFINRLQIFLDTPRVEKKFVEEQIKQQI